MQPEKLSERAAKVAQEAKTYQEAIDRFGPGFEKQWRNSVRRSASEEVEQAFQKLTQEIQKKDREIEQAILLDLDREVWVLAAHTDDRRTYYLSAEKMKRESASEFVAEMRRKGSIYVPVETFNDLIVRLKASILDGQRDEHLHMTAQQLIYIEMCPKITDIGYVQVRRSSQTPEDEKRRKDNNESISRKS